MKLLYLFASQWCKNHKGLFTCEDMKKAYFDAGNTAPNNHNHFGLVFKTLSAEGVILHRGFEKAKNPLAKGRWIQVWVSAKTSETKTNNRSYTAKTQRRLF